MEGDEGSSFSKVDFAIFGISLAMSVAIGIFFAIKDRRRSSTEHYYFGDRNLAPIPLGISMAVSVISGLTMIGTPAEIYLYGLVTGWVGIGNFATFFFTSVYYAPLIHRLALTSIFQYLERRFSKVLSVMCSGVTTVLQIIYMGLALYIPSLALSSATPLSIPLSIAISGSVCIIYTTFGGIKAVVYTDTLQAFIMIIGSILLLVKGTIAVGGSNDVWKIVVKGGRNNVFKITADPTIRSATFAILIGSCFTLTASACTNQSLPQRMLSCETISKARIAMASFLITSTLIYYVSVANGCVLYAYFVGCDPISTGEVEKIDQTALLMMVELFQDIPGAAGLFVAAIFSGTLSTVSTGINSVSAVILHDYVLPIKPQLSMRTRMILSWCFVFGLGLLAVGIAFGTSAIGATTISVSTTALGALGGPIFGIFLLGMFCPWCTNKGAISGLVLGGALSVWLAIGAMLYPPGPEKAQKLPLSTDNCTVTANNFTTVGSYTTEYFTMSNLTTQEPDRPPIADTFYSISFYLFGAFGCIATVIIGIVASFITGKGKPSEMNPELFVPLLTNHLCSEKIIKWFRFGVPPREGKADIFGKKLKHNKSNITVISMDKL